MTIQYGTDQSLHEEVLRILPNRDANVKRFSNVSFGLKCHLNVFKLCLQCVMIIIRSVLRSPNLRGPQRYILLASEVETKFLRAKFCFSPVRTYMVFIKPISFDTFAKKSFCECFS